MKKKYTEEDHGDIDHKSWKEYEERQFLNGSSKNVKIKIQEDDDEFLLIDYFKKINEKNITKIWCDFNFSDKNKITENI